MNKKVVKRGLFPYIFLFIFIAVIMFSLDLANKEVHKFDYREFMNNVESENVKEINIVPKSRAGVYSITGQLKDYKKKEFFTLTMPLTNETMVKLLDAEKKSGFKMETSSDPESSAFLLFLVNVLPMVLLIGLAFFFITRQIGGNNKSMDFGKSKARLTGNDKKVTFDEVAFYINSLIGDLEYRASVIILSGGDHLYWFHHALYELYDNTLYASDRQKYMIKTEKIDRYDHHMMLHSLDDIRNRSDNPAWFDGSRAMRIIANIITHKIGADVVIPTNINMEDGLKSRLNN